MASHILEIGKKGNGEERRSVLTFFSLFDSGAPPRAEQPAGAGGMGGSMDKACASLRSCV